MGKNQRVRKYLQEKRSRVATSSLKKPIDEGFDGDPYDDVDHFDLDKDQIFVDSKHKHVDYEDRLVFDFAI